MGGIARNIPRGMMNQPGWYPARRGVGDVVPLVSAVLAAVSAAPAGGE
jgi:hypothetical protein